LYVPDLDSFYLKFRDEMSYLLPDDIEIVAGLSSHFQSVANDNGAKFAFEWMESSLSNVVFVEGAFDAPAGEPEQVVSDLFDRYCGGVPDR